MDEILTVLIIILEVGAATVIQGRAYAVSGGNSFIAAGLGLITVLYTGLTLSGAVLQFYSASSVTTLILDGTVMVITTYFAWTSSKQLQNMFGTRQSLTVIFLQQGVIRFLFNTRVQTVPSVHIASTPGIQGRLQYIHKTLIEEFGNSGIEYDLETENDMGELEGDTAPSAGIDTEVCITAEEFPWAINPVESALGTLGSGNP
ncbi:hypothetical protein M422DRAFT_249881 [Sphaerobolus stellatus SS14]|uniref:Unplaced genomic scaffold SPHSTscaffold_31, whole genome shotgun sequence n=1 Tax=Sphaerobolus stellatus (strain SS14) TaxID=990650 RepID=A0A0C9W4W4_SPHS4|nr:hypothetical protein M422DRAFT_249881 [Sphaerobolus stellatus SS14]